MNDRNRDIHAALLGTDFSSRRTITRFGLRVVILGLFALSSRHPFWPIMSTLLMVASALSLFLATTRREPVFGSALTHWDEAAIYLLLSRAAAIGIVAPAG